jgi:hypothetical protein
MKKCLLLSLTFGALHSMAVAQIAYDDAADGAYSGGNVHGLNGGYGFSPWISNPTSNTGTAGNFQYTSSQNGNGASGNIDTSGKSFGLYANSSAFSDLVRPINVSMSGVRTVFVDWDCGWIDNGQYSYVAIGNYRFGFTGGGTNFWYDIGAGQIDTGLAFSTDGISLKLALNGTGGYNFSATSLATTSVFATANFSGAQIPTQIRAVNSNAGFNASNNSYINRLKVVAPEPGSFVAVGVGLAIAFMAKRRR